MRKLIAKHQKEGARAVTDADDRRWLLPGTDLLSARSLSLPMGAHVDEAVVEEVCDAVATAKQS